ncbi:MAG: hypothetical protein K0S09_2052 [Sphingobacteriaceae bacterium]|jgi:hypothetical protein|nr:hypothetical protein [Sphingobacteriaceae bacterium]
MATIKLRVNDKILDRVIWLLRQFKKEELEIIEEDGSFNEIRKGLQEDLKRIESDQIQYYSIEEADILLEKSIKEHEN